MGATKSAQESSAVAVFSSPFRFAEWKAMTAEDAGSFRPYAPSGDRRVNAWRALKGRRWIYVFRRDETRRDAPAVLVDELLVNANGDIEATSMQDMDDLRLKGSKDDWPEREERPDPIAIGRSVRFAQRILGNVQQHFFFGSRIRLPSAQIKDLQVRIMDWAPPVTFEPNDPNVIRNEKNGHLLIPVLDPITVLIHLSGYYAEAANELINYSHVHPHQSDAEQKRVKQRNKKIILADIVKKLLDADGTLADDDIVNQSKLHDFRTEAAKQVEYRKKAVEEWGKHLRHWIESKPIDLVRKAHEDDLDELHLFLIPMAQAHARLIESVEGRTLLSDQLVKEKRWDWIHRWVFASRVGDGFQVGRKLGSAGLEWIKSYAPFVAMTHTSPALLRDALEKMYGSGVTLGKVTKGRTHVVLHGWFPQQKEWRHYKLDMNGAPPDGLTAKWGAALNNASVFLDAVNFVFSIASLAEKYDDPDERAWAIVEFTGSTLDLAGSGLARYAGTKKTILKMSAKHVLAVIGFFSGAIDTIVAGRDTLKALEEGNYGKAVGSALVAIGSAGSMVGAVLSLSGTNPWVAVVAFAIVGIGTIVKMLFTRHDDSDFAVLIRHSPWGPGDGKDSEKRPHFSDTDTSKWKYDMDAMFRALMRLMCKVTVEREYLPGQSPNFRASRLTFSWIPDGAEVQVVLEEQWFGMENGTVRPKLEEVIIFERGDGPPMLTKKNFAIDGKDRKYRLVPHDEKMRAALTGVQGATLGHSEIKVRMRFSVEGESFTLPFEGYDTKTLWP